MKSFSGYYPRGIFMILTLMMVQSLHAQYLRNGSLEGPANQDAIPPDYWERDDAYSDPNLLTSYTSQSGMDTYLPVDGSVFVLLRARGAHYAEAHHGRREREYLYQHLIKPLDNNACFQFDASLCTNPDYLVQDELNPNTGFPLRFQVWGSSEPNSRDFLLVDSDPISNLDWQQFSFVFTTANGDISYLLIEVQWDTLNILSEAYNGFVLVDDLELTMLKAGADTLREYTLFYHGDNKDTLSASYGDSYHWYPEGSVSMPWNQSVIVRSYAETVSVSIHPENECPFIEKFHFILDCDTLYPMDTNRVVDHFYRYEENIVLEASEGIEYDWEPEVNLTAYDIRDPHLTAFHDHYAVVVISKYDCVFKEYFNIILHCDTLYPSKTITALDTLIQPRNSVSLRPMYGMANTAWQPPDYLSCTDCQNPEATPRSSIRYTVSLTDEYSCIHSEQFVINVELRIPNAITPNGDGFNDCLQVYGLPEGTSFRLFDQQGMLLLSRDPYDPDDCWNGTDQQGNVLQAGNYWYAFEEPSSGRVHTGFIFLKR
jgi:gliding motility-associated-like protein